MEIPVCYAAEKLARQSRLKEIVDLVVLAVEQIEGIELNADVIVEPVAEGRIDHSPSSAGFVAAADDVVKVMW